MPFASHLRPEQISISPPWRTFAETVAGLLDRLAESGALPVSAKADALRAVHAREAEGSTAVLDIGVGVPHSRIGGIDVPVVALAVSAAGLYEAVPTAPIRIVALVLSPPSSVEEHLRTLADIATMLRSADLRAALLRATDPFAAFDILIQRARSLP